MIRLLLFALFFVGVLAGALGDALNTFFTHALAVLGH